MITPHLRLYSLHIMPSLGWEDHLIWFHNEQALQPPPSPSRQPRAHLELTRMGSSGNPGLLGLSWRRDLRSCLACFSVRIGEAPEKVRKGPQRLSGTPIHAPSRRPRPSICKSNLGPAHKSSFTGTCVRGLGFLSQRLREEFLIVPKMAKAA